MRGALSNQSLGHVCSRFVSSVLTMGQQKKSSTMDSTSWRFLESRSFLDLPRRFDTYNWRWFLFGCTTKVLLVVDPFSIGSRFCMLWSLKDVNTKSEAHQMGHYHVQHGTAPGGRNSIAGWWGHRTSQHSMVFICHMFGRWLHIYIYIYFFFTLYIFICSSYVHPYFGKWSNLTMFFSDRLKLPTRFGFLKRCPSLPINQTGDLALIIMYFRWLGRKITRGSATEFETITLLEEKNHSMEYGWTIVSSPKMVGKGSGKPPTFEAVI